MAFYYYANKVSTRVSLFGLCYERGSLAGGTSAIRNSKEIKLFWCHDAYLSMHYHSQKKNMAYLKLDLKDLKLYISRNLQYKDVNLIIIEK